MATGPLQRNLFCSFLRHRKFFLFRSGALPIPTFEITRDVSSGIFNYAFNLNFASSSSFSKLIEETGKLIDNPYLGTPKGREVMLDYLLSRKAIWLLAGKAINSGMSYPIRSLNPDTAKPSEAELSFDLGGNLSTVTLGGFAVKNIDLGESFPQILARMARSQKHSS